jgi:hypothetical protein
MKCEIINVDSAPLTVEDLIHYLQKFPKDHTVRAYEGEITGIIIESPVVDDSYNEVAHIYTP